jgi:ATP-binding cassette subfamily B protein
MFQVFDKKPSRFLSCATDVVRGTVEPMSHLDLVPVFRRYLLHARLSWRVAPGLSMACVVLTVLSALASAAVLVTTGRLVGSLAEPISAGAGSTAAGTAWWWLAATAAALVIGPVSASVSAAAAEAISARYLVAVSDMIIELGTDPYGIGHLEDPTVSGRLDALARLLRDWLFLTGVSGGWLVLAERLRGVGAVVVLVGLGWAWPALIVVVAWMINARVMARYINNVFDEMLQVTGSGRRRATYLQSLLTAGPTAKEVRLFGLADWLADQYLATWHATMAVVWARRTKSLVRTVWSAVLVLAANAVVFGLLARDAWIGEVSVGSLVSIVLSILALSAFGSLYWSNGFARTTSGLAELVSTRVERGLPGLPARDGSVVPASRSRPVRSRPQAARPRPAAVELNGVAFGYPSRDTATLAGLSVRIPAGQSVALVGVNGAGKSTLIKLLCGLYRPQSGTIRIDGADPGVDIEARRRVSAIFQHFVHYQLPLRDNVGFGAQADDQAVLDHALHDAGGAPLLDELGHGWETILSAEYAGGTDLSGGQWQRVALARALAALSAGAGLLVLDEPTAALDVRTEAALFDRFLQVTRGATTILVSHRLSSVRHADRILVLDNPDGTGARIVEDGSHDELLAAAGVYAEMFTLQASRFAAAAGSEGGVR